MATTIAAENAKQIREPMQVLIKMDVPGTDELNYHNLQDYKVSDGELTRDGMSMRKLADLQGDGFLLDGSCVLYDSTTPASEENGKIGARGVVSNRPDLYYLSVQVTTVGTVHDRVLTVSVNNCQRIKSGNTFYNYTGRSIQIPYSGDDEICFYASSQNVRVEVSQITAGTVFEITNENLVKATVSLRSDLSRTGQTLPESELNVEVYNDADILNAITDIPDDTPITYSAGYDGDMSDERQFYLSGQPEWKDGIVTLHAVDAIHFLDNRTIDGPETYKGLGRFCNVARNQLELAGVQFEDVPLVGEKVYDNVGGRWIVREDFDSREFLAFCNEKLNVTTKTGWISSSKALNFPVQFCYVDAGWPRMTFDSDRRIWKNTTSPHYEDVIIKKSDCGDIKQERDRTIGSITTNIRTIVKDDVSTPGDAQKVGSASWTYGVGASLTFDKYTPEWCIGIDLGPNKDNDEYQKLVAYNPNIPAFVTWNRMISILPASNNSSGNKVGYSPSWSSPYSDSGLIMPTSEVTQEQFGNASYNNAKYYTTFIPWDQTLNGWWYSWSGAVPQSQAGMWWYLIYAGVFDQDATQYDMDIFGTAYEANVEEKTYTNTWSGISLTESDQPVYGVIESVSIDDPDDIITLFPDVSLTRSFTSAHQNHGSFKWKGDPRLQPRDIVKFRDDTGSYFEDKWITIENITITHEAGGTYAEIEYREGEV